MPKENTMKSLTLLVTSLMLVAIILAGCGEEPERDQPEAPAKTMEEYRQEAAEEITAENVEQELDKLEKEIDADVAAETE
jgi:hypothetical protein